MKGRRFRTPKALQNAFEEYMKQCRAKEVLKHQFSVKDGCFVTQSVKVQVPYSVLGFCVYLGMSRENYYLTYRADPEFEEVVQWISSVCANDAMECSVSGSVEPRAIPVLLASHGFTTEKQEVEVESKIPIIIKGEDSLED